MHSLCAIRVPAWGVGPLWVLVALLGVAVVSSCAACLMRALRREDPLLLRVVLVPAVAWHELCHAAGCILAGHRITEIRLHDDRRGGEPAHVNYRYDPGSAWQVAGMAWVGWAPVLINAALLAWIAHVFGAAPLWEQALLAWVSLILLLAMPLSIIDWRGALHGLAPILVLAVLAGLLLVPGGVPLCQLAGWIINVGR